MNDDYEHKRGMDRGNAKIDRQTMIAAMQMKGIGRKEKGGPVTSTFMALSQHGGAANNLVAFSLPGRSSLHDIHKAVRAAAAAAAADKPGYSKHLRLLIFVIWER